MMLVFSIYSPQTACDGQHGAVFCMVKNCLARSIRWVPLRFTHILPLGGYLWMHLQPLRCYHLWLGMLSSCRRSLDSPFLPTCLGTAGRPLQLLCILAASSKTQNPLRLVSCVGQVVPSISNLSWYLQFGSQFGCVLTQIRWQERDVRESHACQSSCLSLRRLEQPSFCQSLYS